MLILLVVIVLRIYTCMYMYIMYFPETDEERTNERTNERAGGLTDGRTGV